MNGRSPSSSSSGASLVEGSPGLSPAPSRFASGGSAASVAVRGRRRARARAADVPSLPSAVPDRLRTERCFIDWLADPVKPDEVQLPGEVEPTSLTTLLGLVCTSSRRLPTEAADMLGLPPGVTIGAAAAELVLAVKDPSGPRCRSYRAAVYYLHDLHALTAAFEEL